MKLTLRCYFSRGRVVLFIVCVEKNEGKSLSLKNHDQNVSIRVGEVDDDNSIISSASDLVDDTITASIFRRPKK